MVCLRARGTNFPHTDKLWAITEMDLTSPRSIQLHSLQPIHMNNNEFRVTGALSGRVPSIQDDRENSEERCQRIKAEEQGR